ncbi:MAG: DUF6340 family protein, partial [Bacteroidota bacterium]|nr:DUF6340 family protein [Bacteroidota bacterium]
KDKFRFNTDSLAIKTCLDSLSVKLAAQNRFDSITILPVGSFPEKRVKEISPDKSEWYAKISEQTGADGLIVLDMFSCFYSLINDNSSPTVDVVTSNIWSVYNSKTHKIIDRFTQIDTLYWNDTDENGQYRKLRIPEKREAIILASGVIGENYSKHVLPAWSMAYRDIMSNGNADLKKAAQLAQKSKWEEAVAIWQNYTESKNKRNRVIALYNMSLASEMNGDVVQAIELTDQAAKASSGAFMESVNESVRKYSAVLYQRKIDIKKLDTQHEIH